ncbi:hypothetical protein ILUMI_24039 [Ignelater luminosus]|uniref:Uncharacterized protein n=1 Tax=Ignelater luminosus TaxID=2038154 RepID=A0A8K0FZ41_IGNLU|nr:hypothetical protein ILUMI_24039 [Ignelater luminosus]
MELEKEQYRAMIFYDFKVGLVEEECALWLHSVPQKPKKKSLVLDSESDLPSKVKSYVAKAHIYASPGKLKVRFNVQILRELKPREKRKKCKRKDLTGLF